MMSRLHAITKLAKRPHFLILRHPGRDVAREAADNKGFLGGQCEVVNHITGDCGKGVPIVKTKGCHAVTSPTKVDGFIPTHFYFKQAVPKLPRRLMSILGGLV